MGHPFLAASRRAGSNRSHDYQGERRNFSGPVPDFGEIQIRKHKAGGAHLAPSSIGRAGELDRLKLDTGTFPSRFTAPDARRALRLARLWPYAAMAAGVIGYAIWRNSAGTAWAMPDNWVFHKHCPPPPPPEITGDGWYFAVATANCLGGQYSGAKFTTLPADVFPTPGTILWPFNSFANNRYQYMALYGMHDPSGSGAHTGFTKTIWFNTCYRDLCIGNLETPKARPLVMPVLTPEGRTRFPYPQLAPDTIGIKEFEPAPLPPARDWLPYREVEPWWIPGQMPEWGPVTPPRRNADPGPVEGPSFEVTPQGVREIPPRHEFKKDHKDMKTRKVRVAVRQIMQVINFLTEGFDYIDALYKALPKKKRRLRKHYGLRNMRPQHKLEVLWENWQDVDMNEAFKNLVENEAEDQAFGRVGKGLRKLNRAMGRPVGVQAGDGAPGKLPKGFNPGKKPWDGWMSAIEAL